MGIFSLFNLSFKKTSFLNPSLASSVTWEIPVAKLKVRRHVESGKIAQECSLKNDAIKIALWY